MITHKKEKKKRKIGRRQPLSGPDAAALGKVLKEGAKFPDFALKKRVNKRNYSFFSVSEISPHGGDCADRKNAREA